LCVPTRKKMTLTLSHDKTPFHSALKFASRQSNKQAFLKNYDKRVGFEAQLETQTALVTCAL
jgi:hypothetical protein